MLDLLRTDPPAVVVVADYAGESGGADGARFGADEWGEALGRTLRALPSTTQVLVVGDTPTPGTAPGVCLSDHVQDAAACDLGVEVRNVVVQEGQRAAAGAAGARFVDLDEYLCNPEACPVIIDNTLVYRDGTHLTATMAARLGEVLGPEVLALLPR
nr:SGNH hydrolase domain-containing protein [Cellulosimicrobium cellulans]